MPPAAGAAIAVGAAVDPEPEPEPEPDPTVPADSAFAALSSATFWAATGAAADSPSLALSLHPLASPAAHTSAMRVTVSLLIFFIVIVLVAEPSAVRRSFNRARHRATHLL